MQENHQTDKIKYFFIVCYYLDYYKKGNNKYTWCAVLRMIVFRVQSFPIYGAHRLTTHTVAFQLLITQHQHNLKQLIYGMSQPALQKSAFCLK